ncbi:heat shock 70 kDa protein 12A-like isoform X2 [Saccostrea echinata]|uniref:heat shock 70 kDa protein 12A-like isoform X2 n=1 Tax=Saccostrea echinata TaxID=191078 RepID=UPI002A81B24B|nr:heat shock 70 kDa protein 12A-like isoform X2 [Saccostrea echinata]
MEALQAKEESKNLKSGLVDLGPRDAEREAEKMSFTVPVLVAAIDFGTTFSGYAFSFRHEFDQDPLKINACNWIAGNQALVSHKTPSVVLLKPDKTFHSFGYDAENKYATLAEDNEHEGWLYFKRFKMTLHRNKSLRRTTIIKDINGKEMPAMTVFTMAIKYLKEHLMKTLTTRVDTFTEDLIRWVLTVPAIWDEGAKQFMMEAAVDAGIERKQLILALEPEAASIYCNHVPIGVMSVNKGKTESYKFKPGTRYMVLDLGGGTADITVHEVQGNQNLREVHHATGGAWGGTKVDDAFYQFLVKLFGNDVLTTLKNDNMDDYISLFRDFETKKRTVKPDLEDKVTITLPLRLLEIFKEETGETLAETLPQTRYAKKVIFKAGKLRVHPEIFKDFFRDTLQGIIQHITEIMSSFEDSVSKILLVGGFSESPMVLKAIKELFPDKKVIAPADPGLAVLKGAVLFGHTPSVISSRISRYSIGFEVNVPFIEGLHPKDYKIKRPADGKTMCQHIFEALVQKGEEVPIGHKIENTYTPSEEDAVTGIGIYQSTSQNPTYTTEKNCTKIGTIKLRRPNGGWSEDSLIHAVVEFGGTQFDVALTDDCLDETYRHSYDFLRN